MVKAKAQTKDLVVVDLESDKDQWVQLDQGTASPSIVRIFKDHIEIDMIVDSSTGKTKKKTWKFYYHDLLLMNETLYRIQHPH